MIVIVVISVGSNLVWFGGSFGFSRFGFSRFGRYEVRFLEVREVRYFKVRPNTSHNLKLNVVPCFKAN